MCLIGIIVVGSSSESSVGPTVEHDAGQGKKTTAASSTSEHMLWRKAVVAFSGTSGQEPLVLLTYKWGALICPMFQSRGATWEEHLIESFGNAIFIMSDNSQNKTQQIMRDRLRFPIPISAWFYFNATASSSGLSITWSVIIGTTGDSQTNILTVGFWLRGQHHLQHCKTTTERRNLAAAGARVASELTFAILKGGVCLCKALPNFIGHHSKNSAISCTEYTWNVTPQDKRQTHPKSSARDRMTKGLN